MRAVARAVRASLCDLRYRPLQSLLTALGLFVGILAVCVIVAFSAVAKDALLFRDAQQKGETPTVTASARLGDIVAMDPVRWNRMMRRLHETHTALTAPVDVQLLDAAGHRLPGSVQVYAGDLGAVRRLPLPAGASWSFDEAYPPRVVSNTKASSVIAAVAAPDQARPVPVRTDAVVSDGAEDAMVYLPLATYQRAIVPHDEEATVTLWSHAAGADPATLVTTMAQAAREAGIPLVAAPQRSDTYENVIDQLRLLTGIFQACAAIALVVAALGILNIGLSTVKERARELVIRRALGATRRDLVLLVLGNSVLVALVSSAVAVGVSVALIEGGLLSMMPSAAGMSDAHFPPSAALWATLAAVGTALVGGLIPAVHAARLEVADALRA